MATPQPSTSNNISSLPSPPPPHPTKTFPIKRNINMKVFEKEFKSNRFFRKTKTQTQAQQPCSKQGYRNFCKNPDIKSKKSSSIKKIRSFC